MGDTMSSPMCEPERPRNTVFPSQILATTTMTIRAFVEDTTAAGLPTQQKNRQKVLTWLDSVVCQLEKGAERGRREVHLIKGFPRSQLQNEDFKRDPIESFLHTLPGELRNDIYRLVGFPEARQSLRSIMEPELAQAIPSLRSEIHAMLFAESTFEVELYSKFQQRPNIISEQRVKDRAGKYGTGKLAISPESWIKTADHRAVRLHHIRIRVCEKDGYKICDIFLNNTKGCKLNGPRMAMRGVESQYTKGRLKYAKKSALKYVASLRKKKDFPGFSLEQLETVAKLFGDPEHGS